MRSLDMMGNQRTIFKKKQLGQLAVLAVSLLPSLSVTANPAGEDLPTQAVEAGAVASDNVVLESVNPLPVQSASEPVLAIPFDLFEVRLTPTEYEKKQSKKQKTNLLMKRALKTELIRLTGDKSIVDSEEAKQILKTPKKWLQTFKTEPKREDGVIVGEVWVFQFNEQRLYEVFQQQGLIIWPSEKRPVTSVFGSQNRGGQVTEFSNENLLKLPIYRMDDLANMLGLNVYIADNADSWVMPEALDFSTNAALQLEEMQSDYALSYQWVQNAEGQEMLIWRLYDPSGQEIISDLLINEDEPGIEFYRNALESVFLTLIDFYSQPYRDQASILGSVTLIASDLEEFDDVIALESYLQQLKPLVHRAELISIKDKTLLFEIDYQGYFAELLEEVGYFTGAKTIASDALVGEITLSFDLFKAVEEEQDPNQLETQAIEEPQKGMVDLTTGGQQ